MFYAFKNQPTLHCIIKRFTKFSGFFLTAQRKSLVLFLILHTARVILKSYVEGRKKIVLGNIHQGSLKCGDVNNFYAPNIPPK